ncbi:ATP-binding protein [Mesorhizobium sp. CA8]|uniref:ATP-binding protein n=1 Tax=Mesorhizobium sp. CA8 TaxID=2876637 RepID=UPI001CC9F12B|nr:helicase HerA-like domain-containing protein [Mesorhizobium sp. CA8]MBZ9760107.1 ATP-binding protein [Mesorhizobium sp. CA8]
MLNEQNYTAKPEPTIAPSPAEARNSLARDAEANGGAYEEPAEYKGSIGRTTFDDRSSSDGTVTVVLPPENIDVVPSQSLLKIHSVADQREYIATVTAGPFCEPDGLRADAPALIASVVNRAMIMPRHHGRVQATIIGQRVGSGLTAARHRPKPNSPAHSVPDAEMADILSLNGNIRLGLVYGHDTVEVKVPSHEKSVLPRHTAVVGTTGGGKSTGVGRYTAGLQESGVCTFLFDVEGEYAKLNEATDSPHLLAALAERGLEAHGVDNTHLYHLVGRDCANPGHPNRTAFSLRLSEISPFAFTEIMDLSQAQEDRLLKVYEIAKGLMRDLKIFPREGEKRDQELVLEIDEFERGWPLMTLDHLGYLVSGIIGLAEGQNDEPSFYRARGFTGNWIQIKRTIMAQIGGVHDDDDDEKKGRKGGPKFGDTRSWKVVASRLSRLRRLGVFDNGNASPLRYTDMLAPGRVNIIDLSDLENMDVRNLAIAEILRGILIFQQEAYDEATAAGEKPLATNVIIEEAHEFLSAKRVTKMPTLRDQLVRIAKRGRKRHLGLTFVTQSPNDLPDEVLGLVNNWIIYKIDDPIARRLRSFVPNADESLWHMVRSLGQGQALASFTHMRRPVIAAMDPSPGMLRMTD